MTATTTIVQCSKPCFVVDRQELNYSSKLATVAIGRTIFIVELTSAAAIMHLGQFACQS